MAFEVAKLWTRLLESVLRCSPRRKPSSKERLLGWRKSAEPRDDRSELAGFTRAEGSDHPAGALLAALRKPARMCQRKPSPCPGEDGCPALGPLKSSSGFPVVVSSQSPDELVFSAAFGIQRAVPEAAERESEGSCWWENPKLVNGTKFSTASPRGFSSAPPVWQSCCGSAGRTVWIRLYFTQIPPWCQEQGWDYPSLATGNGTVGQP